MKIPDNQVTNNAEPLCPCVSGLSYASHTVGFTPPTSLTRAGMSYYNSPGLHVQHMGASHGITVSVIVGGRQLLTHNMVVAGLLGEPWTAVCHLLPSVLGHLSLWPQSVPKNLTQSSSIETHIPDGVDSSSFMEIAHQKCNLKFGQCLH